MFKTTSKHGSFQVTDDGYVQVVRVFSSTPEWREPINIIQAISVQHGRLMYSIAIHGSQVRHVETLTKKDIDNLIALLPTIQFVDVQELPTQTFVQQIQPMQAPQVYQQPQYSPQQSQPITQTPPPAATKNPTKPRWLMSWYEDDSKLTHVATYEKEKDFERELEKAYQHGWIIQGQTARDGKISGRKVIGGAIVGGLLTGGIGLGVGALVGAKRSKDKITITYVRGPEWLASHR